MDSFSFDQSLLQTVYDAEGWMLYPQVFLAWCAIGFVIYVYDRSRAAVVYPRRLINELKNATSFSGVQQVCHGERKLARSRLARVVGHISDSLSADGRSTSSGSAALGEVIEDGVEDVQLSLERWLGYLHVAAQASMLTGLLGTVLGLYRSFMVIGSSNVAPQPSQLADGVSQALMTTIVGLSVAIPALIVLTILQGRASRCLFEFREAINLVVPHLRRLHDVSDGVLAANSSGDGQTTLQSDNALRNETENSRRNGHATAAESDQRDHDRTERVQEPVVPFSSPGTQSSDDAPSPEESS